MGPRNVIHPTAILGSQVILGRDNRVGPYTVILGPAMIGDSNWIGPSVVIGTPGEARGGRHPDWNEPQGVGVQIGDGNVIREFATVQQGVLAPTTIGSDCYVMTKAHIPHEALLEDRVTLSCATQIGGHAWVGEGANLGLGSQVRQRLCIGAGAMIGMNSTVTRDMPPFALAMGSPARISGVNRIGMLRSGYAEEVVVLMDERYRAGDFGCPEDAPEKIRVAFQRFQSRCTERDQESVQHWDPTAG